MTHSRLGKFLGFLVLALPLLGCAGITQDIQQEIKDNRREMEQRIGQAEKTYESRRYLGLTSEKSEEWNSTDWTLWMDTHGGGR